MSLWSAVWEPMRARLAGRRTRDQQVASLIEEFLYPRLGPGMMWERCAELVEAAGSKVHFESPVTRISHDHGHVSSVESTAETGAVTRYSADHVISSMPLAELVAVMEPSPPDDGLDAARQLGFRDYLLVALVVPAERVDWTDNWVYVHEPDIDAMAKSAIPSLFTSPTATALPKPTSICAPVITMSASSAVMSRMMGP